MVTIKRDRRTRLLVFAVSLLSNVFGFLQLDLLQLHLLLVLHGSVLNNLHASVRGGERGGRQTVGVSGGLQIHSSTHREGVPRQTNTQVFMRISTVHCVEGFQNDDLKVFF